jgi:hypothetical protein
MQSAGNTLTKERLSVAKDCLDYLDGERLRRADPGFGRMIEQKIISREILELELQEAEERITTICDAAERALDLLQ